MVILVVRYFNGYKSSEDEIMYCLTITSLLMGSRTNLWFPIPVIFSTFVIISNKEPIWEDSFIVPSSPSPPPLPAFPPPPAAPVLAPAPLSAPLFPLFLPKEFKIKFTNL